VAETAYRLCNKCGFERPLTDFYKKHSGRYGYSSMCKAHAKAYTREWVAAHPEYSRQYEQWRKEHHAERLHARGIKKRYGMGIDDFLGLLESQEDCCLICLGRFDFSGYHKTDKSPVVDHDHTTGVVRGLICKKCNIALGCFKDSPAVIASALRYLRLRKELV
jgi:hypothetical protein